MDLDAIQKGDPVKNLQLFPGDRLVIGRDANVAATIQQDREAASFHAMLNTVRQVALMSSELVKATPDLSGKEREKLVGEWVSVWLSGARPPNGRDSSTVMFSELMMKTLRLVAPKNSGPRNLPVAPPR